jgi:uncharacterized protein DUF5677
MATLKIIIPPPGDFVQKGYLGDEIRDLLPKVRETHKDAFDFFYELNRYAQTHFAKLTSPSEENMQKSLAISFFAKILEGTQAACILSNYGLAVDARTVLRSVLEATFLLGNTVKEPSFAKRYLGADDFRRLRRLKQYANDTSDKKLADSIQRHINENALRDLEHLSKLAENVGMNTHYKWLYRMFCDDTHGNLRSLQRSILPGGDLNWGPQFGYAPADVLVGGLLLLLSLWQLEPLFDLKIETELQAFKNRHTALMPKYIGNST